MRKLLLVIAIALFGYSAVQSVRAYYQFADSSKKIKESYYRD